MHCSQNNNHLYDLYQVWFQNARAKFRRGVGGKDGLTETGENSPSAEDQNSNDEMISESESQNDLNDNDR